MDPETRVVLTASGRWTMDVVRCPPTESIMALPRTVAEVLKHHVTFQLEGIDRM